MTIFAAIQAVALLQLTLCGWLVPTLSGPARPFDVAVPPDGSARAVSDAVRRRYRVLVAAGGCAVTAVTVGTTWHATVTAIATATTGAIASLFLFGWLAYCHARGTLIRHTADLPRDTATSRLLGHPTGPGGVPARWMFPVVASWAATVAIGAARYHDLPSSIAIRWTAGLADRRVPASAESAFSLVVPQMLLTLTTLAAIGFAWSTDTGRRSASAGRACRGLLALCTSVQLCLLTASLILWGLLPAPAL